MATIKARRQANGAIRYTAIVRKRVDKVIVHREAKTFMHRSAALSWARHREVELDNQAVPGRMRRESVTLAALIRWYIETFESISRWQRSKQSHLEFLEHHAIGKINALELTTAALIGHVRPEVAQEAREACGTLRLIGKARKRARRPTLVELARLRDYFAARDRRAEIPMLAIMDFAIASARRQAEIRHLEWIDNDAIGRTGVVRDAKQPRHKEGNHRRFKYTPGAWAIVERQPRKAEYIFPYDDVTVRAGRSENGESLSVAQGC